MRASFPTIIMAGFLFKDLANRCMNRIALLTGIVLIGILALLQIPDKERRVFVPNNSWDDDVWFG